jgi:threonine dehydratase
MNSKVSAESPLAVAVDDVQAAALRITERVLDTPFLHSETLSQITGAGIWIKFENLQFTGSFKERGALNKLLQLTVAERTRGVVAASAGNHAQGVAYHAAKLGIPATIVMPTTAPTVKAQRTRAFGAEVILHGREFQHAAEHAQSLVESRGLTLVHPYDDPAIIAGQGTVALEIVRSGVALDAMVVPIGGGGLLAGVSVVLSALQPSVELIGVQSEWYSAAARGLGFWSGPEPSGASVAEGIAVARPGALTMPILQRHLSHVSVVPESRIEESMALLLQIEKTLAEGAGAAGLAAVLHEPARFRGRRVGIVVCGGNVDNRVLVAVLQRQLVREGRLMRLTVRVPDQAGSLARVCTVIGELGGNINTVAHDRTFLPSGPKSTEVDIEVELPDATTGDQIRARLEALGFGAVRAQRSLTD